MKKMTTKHQKSLVFLEEQHKDVKSGHIVKAKLGQKFALTSERQAQIWS
jgi:hypothetical protein